MRRAASCSSASGDSWVRGPRGFCCCCCSLMDRRRLALALLSSFQSSGTVTLTSSSRPLTRALKGMPGVLAWLWMAETSSGDQPPAGKRTAHAHVPVLPSLYCTLYCLPTRGVRSPVEARLQSQKSSSNELIREPRLWWGKLNVGEVIMVRRNQSIKGRPSTDLTTFVTSSVLARPGLVNQAVALIPLCPLAFSSTAETWRWLFTSYITRYSRPKTFPKMVPNRDEAPW
mmetsp:Transcript_2605/g.5757  ORF Transcript_2605/g.5757 Transcript_2605/m.5757 type:complete len:229 (+) Transcript_2605:601-1287(+)